MDWSHDGKWLLYLLQRPADFGGSYLWAVKPDGTGAFQIDPKPITGEPVWSPAENIIAYLVKQGNNDGYAEGKTARIHDDGKVTITSLFPAFEQVVDISWAPDGNSVAISLPRTKERPLKIDRFTLKGERTTLFTHGEPIGQNEAIYILAATGLKWSPNGKFLVYFLLPNSASIAADGVSIQLLNVHTRQTINLGEGLHYREWLAWSPDSTRLAYIQGRIREATTNKQLYLIDTQNYKITNAGKKGFVDTYPVWSQKPPYDLLFVRGKSVEWKNISLPRVYVPGQRIWVRIPKGKQQELTSAPMNTADYAPQLSPDKKNLLYLRLFSYNKGSIYLKHLPNEEEVEFIRGLSGSPGYYANYLPSWIKVYWKH